MLTTSRQVDGTVKYPSMSLILLLFKVCSTISWRGLTQEMVYRQYVCDSFSKGRLSKRQCMKRCARYTLRERTQHYRNEELFKPSLAACAKLSLSAGPIVASLRPGFDSHSSYRCSSDAAARAVDVLELPGPASCLLLVVVAASSPWARLNGVQVSKEALQLALSFFHGRTV